MDGCDVLARDTSCHREMADRAPYKPRCALPADQRHSILELHVAYAAKLSRIGRGDRDLVDIKRYGVSQMSLANQKRPDAKQSCESKQTARVPAHHIQASVNAFSLQRAHGVLVPGAAH